MPDNKMSFPQIPIKAWWSIRSLLIAKPTTKITDSLLASELNIHKTAAKNYIADLKKARILDDENKITELAERWRHDDTYKNATQDIVKAIYPEELVSLAPPWEPSSENRKKAEGWFAKQGVGAGTARNRAATYFTIGAPNPPDSRQAKTSDQTKLNRQKQRIKQIRPPKNEKSENVLKKDRNSFSFTEKINSDQMPLYINLQIHISSEASGDQIEQIFSAMKKYLFS